ncbi:hypothetical protein ACLOJK_022697 [Asimina triloba]
MGVGEHRRQGVTLKEVSQDIPITIDHCSSNHEPQRKIQQIMASGTISIRQIKILTEHPSSSLIHQTIGRMFGQTQITAT